MKLGTIGALGSTALVTLALVLTPAVAQSSKTKKARPALSFDSSPFTPAVGDPRLAAAFAKRGLATNTFHFTPSSSSMDKSKAVRVAVRARAATPNFALRNPNEGSASRVTAITPTTYNLGVAVGWKQFALSGDVGRVEGGVVPGERDSAEVGVSYSNRKFSTKLQVAAERAEGTQRLIGPDATYSLDVGGSYSIARNLSVSGGVRYKIQSERLEPLADERRDSQAVYIGTAFRF